MDQGSALRDMRQLTNNIKAGVNSLTAITNAIINDVEKLEKMVGIQTALFPTDEISNAYEKTKVTGDKYKGYAGTKPPDATLKRKRNGIESDCSPDKRQRR
ncbi:hypothetical protein F5884DRAFT_758778 [Xylogone sp. PMI_703]|nr:hypothetical protein F5884DRAFT_758778 [Xylogone sp. PMI_703]